MNKAISILVTLDQEYNQEDLEHILEALRMIRCVLHAEPAPDSSLLERVSLKHQIRTELIEKLWEALK